MVFRYLTKIVLALVGTMGRCRLGCRLSSNLRQTGTVRLTRTDSGLAKPLCITLPHGGRRKCIIDRSSAFCHNLREDHPVRRDKMFADGELTIAAAYD
jgi:hypothetical protein